MSIKLTLRTRTNVPLEAQCINPDTVKHLSQSGVEHLEVIHGNETARLGDFFTVKGKGHDTIHVEGDTSNVKYLGAGMTQGEVIIDGDVSMHLGCAMTGGKITVKGNAGDWVGPEMSGGQIVVKGNAGHMVGSAYRGQPTGILGGEIFVHGNVKNEAGNSMRRGLIAVGGNAGDFTGVNLLAGSVIVCGEMGARAGAGMKRGTIVSFSDAEMLPTFEYACTYHPVFLRFYLKHLRDQGFDIDDRYINGRYDRWSGDSIELNRGEVLLFNR
ncbi:MAG: formylmethanofuran dehydrogenase subunit C [Gammaproteobacteria bacterium]|nr:formylmethanofuran dehydrogenase subunit C [Gammaproteobacteria bacterium]